MTADQDHITYVAIELSRSTWLVAARLPRTEKPQLHRIVGGDTTALLTLLSSLRALMASKLGGAIGVACCIEAGRDGFWLHRRLIEHGITSYVLEPTSDAGCGRRASQPSRRSCLPVSWRWRHAVVRTTLGA